MRLVDVSLTNFSNFNVSLTQYLVHYMQYKGLSISKRSLLTQCVPLGLEFFSITNSFHCSFVRISKKLCGLDKYLINVWCMDVAYLFHMY